MAKIFNIPKFQEFEIVENGEVVGAIRVKPNGILWSPKGEHSWYGLTLKQLSDFGIENGKKQKK